MAEMKITIRIFLNMSIWAINFIIKSITRSFIMLNTTMENEDTSFANISITFLRSRSQHSYTVNMISGKGSKY